MATQTFLGFFGVVVYIILAIVVIWTLTYEHRRKKAGIEDLKKTILAKATAFNEISVWEVGNFARAFGIGRQSIDKAMSQLLAETKDKPLYECIKKVALDLEKKAPFENLPDEVKPSLHRIQELIDASALPSDALLLSSIQNALGNHVELKREAEAAKHIGKWLNALSIVGFFVGIFGLYLTFKSPGIADFETMLHQQLKEFCVSPANTVPAPVPALIQRG